MTRKEFESLRPGQLVMFQRCGRALNGLVVPVDRKLNDRDIVAPNPEWGNELCVWPYSHFIVVK